MKRVVCAGLLLGLGFGLAACADRAAEQARFDAVDNKDCTDLGFKPDTEAYGNCRLKLKEIRAKQDGNSSGVNFGVGLGIAHGF